MAGHICQVTDQGVAEDLVVRPFQWKGSIRTSPEFIGMPRNNELGTQPVELTGEDVDRDGDGVG